MWPSSWAITASSSSQWQREHSADGKNHGCAPNSHCQRRDDFIRCSQHDVASDLNLIAYTEEGTLDFLGDHSLSSATDDSQMPPSTERAHCQEEKAGKPYSIDPGQHTIGAHCQPIGRLFEAGGEGQLMQDGSLANGTMRDGKVLGCAGDRLAHGGGGRWGGSYGSHSRTKVERTTAGISMNAASATK